MSQSIGQVNGLTPELRRGEERLSFPFRPKNPPKLTFFIITTTSNRLKAACGRLCCRDALRSHARVAEPLQRQIPRLGGVGGEGEPGDRTRPDPRRYAAIQLHLRGVEIAQRRDLGKQD